jgi:hypothetical protein
VSAEHDQQQTHPPSPLASMPDGPAAGADRIDMHGPGDTGGPHEHPFMAPLDDATRRPGQPEKSPQQPSDLD